MEIIMATDYKVTCHCCVVEVMLDCELTIDVELSSDATQIP